MLCWASFQTPLVKFGSQGKWLNAIKADQIQDHRFHVYKRKCSVLSVYARRGHDKTCTWFQTHAEPFF